MLNLCLLTPTIFSYMLFLIIKYYYYMLPPCLPPPLPPRKNVETLLQGIIVTGVSSFRLNTFLIFQHEVESRLIY